MKTSVLYCLNDNDLVRTLDSLSDLSDREKLLVDRLAYYVSQERLIEEIEKYYERVYEQSEFRRQLIEEMIQISEEWPKKYHKILNNMLDNSYVEL